MRIAEARTCWHYAQAPHRQKPPRRPPNVRNRHRRQPAQTVPGWPETEKLWPQWKAQGPELLQAKADATLLWVKAQEDAGLDIVGDGEQSRQHFVHGFLEQVDGIDFEHKVTMGIRNNRYEAQVPQVVAPLKLKGRVHAFEAQLARAPHAQEVEVHAAWPHDHRGHGGRPLLWRPREDGHGLWPNC